MIGVSCGCGYKVKLRVRGNSLLVNLCGRMNGYNVGLFYCVFIECLLSVSCYFF